LKTIFNFVKAQAVPHYLQKRCLELHAAAFVVKAWGIVGLAVFALLAACVDQQWQEQVAALGPEQPSIPIGPLHRSGQACLLCHSPTGNAPPLLAAGTVYRDPSATLAAAGVAVILIDARRQTYVTYSNCAGNFFVFPSEYQPQLPLWVSLRYQLLGQRVQVDMESPMHRDGDCGSCHRPKAGPSSAGPVFLSDDPARLSMIPRSDCTGGQQ
jgi:mono/diheme cytochrome c family protein